jgi:hypothetical protein
MAMERIFDAGVRISKVLDDWAAGAKTFGQVMRDAWSNVPVLGGASEFGRAVGGSNWLRKFLFSGTRQGMMEDIEAEISREFQAKKMLREAAQRRIGDVNAQFVPEPTRLEKLKTDLASVRADTAIAFPLGAGSGSGFAIAEDTIQKLEQAIAEETIVVARATMMNENIIMEAEAQDAAFKAQTEAWASLERNRRAEAQARRDEAARQEWDAENAEYDAQLNRAQEAYDRRQQRLDAARTARERATASYHSNRPDLLMGAALDARMFWTGGSTPDVPKQQLAEQKRANELQTQMLQALRNNRVTVLSLQ